MRVTGAVFRRGQGMLEMALVLPLFMILACAIADFARIHNAQQTLHRVTKQTVNSGTKVKADGSRYTDAELRDLLQAAVLPPLVGSEVIVNRLDSAAAVADGRESVFVSVSYNVPLITPLLSAFFNQGRSRVDSTAQLAYATMNPQRAAAPPPVSIESDGTIVTNRIGSATIRVLGKTSYGIDPARLPITLQMDVQNPGESAQWETAFGGNPVNGGEEMLVTPISEDARIALSARSRYHDDRNRLQYDVTYNSNTPVAFTDNANEFHVQVLRNGDAIPDKLPTDAQLAPYLAPYLDGAKHSIKMGDNDTLLLWEFSTNYASTDYQDLAVLVQHN